jgi:hypothetical protein
MNDKLNAQHSTGAGVIMRPTAVEVLAVCGRFHAECYRKGELLWEDDYDNTVVTVGKNLILDQAFAGSAYTATEYMGLVSSVSYSAIAATDTMASHPGWTEAGTTNAPTYSGNRPTCVWAAASAGAKALSAALSFSITGGGTIKGSFLVGGAGASNAVMNTSGVLVSSGLFTGGDRAVLNGDTVNVSWSISI